MKEVRLDGRLYKLDAGRWYVDSRKRWRPVYDTAQLAALEDCLLKGG